MAKKQPLVTRYYAHYDKLTGKIYSVSNEKTAVHPDSVEIPFDEYEEFITGYKKFHDYLIGYAKTADGKTCLVPMQISEQLYGFRNNIFEWITDAPVKNTELIVDWVSKSSQWEFTISKKCKNRILQTSLTSVVFFVMLGDDFDFLIRTIIIEIADLIENDKVVIPFTSNIEADINKISIASKIAFQTYGLRIHE